MEKKLTDEMESMLTQFDELGFIPTTTMPVDAEEYAKAWKNTLRDLFERMCAIDNAKEAEIKRLKRFGVDSIERSVAKDIIVNVAVLDAEDVNDFRFMLCKLIASKYLRKTMIEVE